MSNKIMSFWGLLKKASHLFVKYNGLKLSAALSYYTVFSLAPVLIVIISITGIFFGEQAVEGKIYHEIRGMVGDSTALQVQDIIRNIQQSHHTTLGSILGFAIVLIGASGIFSEIQDSINFMWSVRITGKNGWLRFVSRKLLSFSLLASLAFLLLVSLIASAMIDLLSDRLKVHFPNYPIFLFSLINPVIILSLISALFVVIFKVLPDAVIRWKDAFIGALFTGFLFLIGKFFIGLYLGNAGVGHTYGVTASIIILMLWVYYSSIILYYGAAFTGVYAKEAGRSIRSRVPAEGKEKKNPQ